MISGNNTATLSVKNFDKHILVRCPADVETLPWDSHGKVVLRQLLNSLQMVCDRPGHGAHACAPQAGIAFPGKATGPGCRLHGQCQRVVTQTFARRSSASFKVASCFAKQNRTIPDSFGVL